MTWTKEDGNEEKSSRKKLKRSNKREKASIVSFFGVTVFYRRFFSIVKRTRENEASHFSHGYSDNHFCIYICDGAIDERMKLGEAKKKSFGSFDGLRWFEGGN
jgi:hypothetical protein